MTDSPAPSTQHPEDLSRDEAVANAISLLVSRGIDTIEKYDALIAAMDARDAKEANDA